MIKVLMPLLVGGIVIGMTSSETIPAGKVGVVYDRFNGGIQEEVLEEGFNFIKPWVDVNEFNTSIETVYMSADKREGSSEDESITITCSDGSLNADISFRYRFDSELVPSVQKNFRGKNGEQIIQDLRGQLRGWIASTTKDYTTMEAHLLKKDEINSKLVDSFNEKGKKYGVIFEEVTIMETRASEEVRLAIEQRQKISQELEQQKLKLEKAEIAKEEARLLAEKQLIETKAQNERKLLNAKAEKEANELKSKGLTETILKEKAIDKWNGVVPATVGADTIIGGVK